MRTVIFGLSKSGTTTLFYKLKNSFPPRTVCLFEPQSFSPAILRTRKRRIRALLFERREPDVLAKVMAFRRWAPLPDIESFSSFEKRILIVRDPRDRLISRLLYGVYESTFSQRDDMVRAFLELLRRKEADPRSVSVKTLLKIFADLNGERFSPDDWSASYRHHSIDVPLTFDDGQRRLYLFKYEDMIDRRLDGLEEYLGVKLKGDASVAPELGRVARTRSYGNWRNWFTVEDVEYLRPVLQPFLDRYYAEADWTLNPFPSVPAEYTSLYVERIVNEKRAVLKLPPFDRAGRS